VCVALEAEDEGRSTPLNPDVLEFGRLFLVFRSLLLCSFNFGVCAGVISI
jgi:hypothetical protein